MTNSQKKLENNLWKDAPYGSVFLLDTYMEHARQLELTYLKSLEPDRLLAGFYETAGKKPKAQRYEGWEQTEIQGHTLGHYLTAVSQAYGYSKDKELKVRVHYLVEELNACQRRDGYLFAWKEEIFDRVEEKKPAWVPWYTMHKILSGLLAAYQFTGYKTALETAEGLGNWIAGRCLSWDEEIQKVVLSVEYGGMNDCLYELYALAGEERFAQAAHVFDELFLFENLHENRDVLNGRHANTTIPKILGALNRYRVIGETEQFYLEAAERFWEMVVSHHTYVTGGNSEWEHFGKADVLDAERTACNCETCNTYNMLKLTKGLFEITGDKKYADYYGNTSLNAILSSQNPETGMTMYFQPMATGYFKVYGTPFNSFWCCTGSGMENFTKLHEGIYFTKEKVMSVCRYVSSSFFWEAEGIQFQMNCSVLEDVMSVKLLVVKAEGRKEKIRIRLALPKWLLRPAKASLNGQGFPVKGQWAELERVFEAGDELALNLPMNLEVHSMPDNTDAVAFTYGPYLLSAGLGKVMLNTTYTGVDVLVPEKEFAVKDYLVLDGISAKQFKEHIGEYLIKKQGSLEFHLKDQMEELVFTPHYERYQERYGIYWLLYEKGSNQFGYFMKEKEHRERLKHKQTDVVPVGNDQYELAHKIRGEKTDSEQFEGHPCRFFKENGWFSYEMSRAEEGAKLCMTVSSFDEGTEFMVFANGQLLKEIYVEKKTQSFYTIVCELSSTYISRDKKITFRFENKKGICRIFDELYLEKCEG